MKTIKVKKKEFQKLELHIYIHHDAIQYPMLVPNRPTDYTTGMPCPICGKTGPHTCVTCTS